MKIENLLITISLALLIFTNALNGIIALSTSISNILNLSAIILATVSLVIQLKKMHSHKYAVLNK